MTEPVWGASRRPQATAADRPLPSKGHGAKSGVLRGRAILAILSEDNLATAASRVGVSERTIRRWTSEPAFQQELDFARRAAFQAGLDRVQALTAEAVATLASLLRQGPPTVRLGAARTVLELAFHRREEDAILGRLDELEARQKDQEGYTRR